MKTKFLIGDLVKLKSGGPKMTIHNDHKWDAIAGVNDYEIVTCAWFNEKNEVKKEPFRADALEKVN